MAPEVNIRRCGPGDEPALSLVGQATFLETYAGVLPGPDILAHCMHAHSAALYLGWLSQPDYALWLVEAQPGGAAIGYMAVTPPDLPLPDTAGDVELKRIYLFGRFQGGGLGKRLVSTALVHARAIGARRLLLGVYTENKAAIGFYERLGFSKAGTRHFTVGAHDCDDHIMGMAVNG